MAVTFNTAVKNARGDAITTATGNAAKLKLYGGSVPANAAAALGGATHLATLTCGTPFAAGASGGVLTAGSIATVGPGDNSNVPGSNSVALSFYRLETSGGTVIAQGTAGPSACDLNVTGLSSSLYILQGGTVSVSSFTLTEGA